VNSDTLYPWLERHTPYLYFHRSRFRTKLWFWMKYMVGAAKKKAAKVNRDVDPVPDATARIPAAALRAYATQFDRRPADDYPMLDRLPEFVDGLARQHIQAFVVILPMAAAGTRRVPEYEELLAAIRAHAPADSLDLSRASDKFPDELFYDVGHPNKAGRVVFTRELAAWLKTQRELAP
jgi:lysophospholipase L1-like esterase